MDGGEGGRDDPSSHISTTGVKRRHLTTLSM